MKIPGLIVLGMHRSGTSCLAGMLQSAGFFTDIVEEWSPDNNKGSRENSAVVHLNDTLLKKSGGSWHQTAISLVPSKKQIQKRDEILKVLTSAQRPWMFKDPRTLLTLPFWLGAIPDVRMVGIFRHPMAVANSLSARNSMPIAEGIRLWMTYNQELLKVVELRKAPLLHFSNDLGGLAESARKILEEYFSEELSNNVLHADRLQDFISNELVHQIQPLDADLTEALLNAGLTSDESEAVNDLWKSLLVHALNQPSTSHKKEAGSPPSRKKKTRAAPVKTIVSDLVEQDNVKATLLELENDLSSTPERADLWQKGLQIIKREGNADLVLLWVKNGLDSIPEDPSLLFEQAKLTWQSGDEEKAILTLEHVCSLAPGWAPALNLLSKWYYAKKDWQKAATVLNEMSTRSQLEPADLKFVQLFIDTGKGFSEEESIRLPINLNTQPQKIEFGLTAFKKIQRLRFDPINDYAVIKLDYIKILDVQNEAVDTELVSSNAQSVEGNTHFFNVIDTQINIKVPDEPVRSPSRLIAKVQYLHTGTSALLKCSELVNQQIAHADQSKQDEPPKPTGAMTDETKQFLSGWKFEGFESSESSDTEVVLKGWFIPKRDQSINIALRYDGLTRSYPLNIERADLIDKSPGIAQRSNFGFQYAVPKSTSIEIGIEHDMRLYWIETIHT